MNVVPISYYLVLSAILFGLGIVAFVFKRNIITIFMAIELMLNAVNLAFVAFARAYNQLDGLVFVFFVIVVAAAEAAVGLAIVITVYQNRRTLNIEQINLLKFCGSFWRCPCWVRPSTAFWARISRSRLSTRSESARFRLRFFPSPNWFANLCSFRQTKSPG